MDPHATNALNMHSGPLSIPMPMAMVGPNGSNSQAMTMGINAMNVYGVPRQQHQQQQMMVNVDSAHPMNVAFMAMRMNHEGLKPSAPLQAAAEIRPAGAQSMCAADWRTQFTRKHRANLIAKIYNEMVRVSTDPLPGIKLWMNVSWYELTLYKESCTQEEYINNISLVSSRCARSRRIWTRSLQHRHYPTRGCSQGWTSPTAIRLTTSTRVSPLMHTVARLEAS